MHTPSSSSPWTSDHLPLSSYSLHQLTCTQKNGDDDEEWGDGVAVKTIAPKADSSTTTSFSITCGVGMRSDTSKQSTYSER